MRLKQTVTEQTTISRLYPTPPPTRTMTTGPASDLPFTMAAMRDTGVVQAQVTTARDEVVVSRAGAITSFLLAGLSWAALVGFAFYCLAHLLMEMPLPLTTLRAAVAAFSVASILCLFPVHRQKSRRYLTTVLGMLLLAGITWIPNGSARQSFLMDFTRIQPGMTVAEVRDRMGNRYVAFNPSYSPDTVLYDALGESGIDDRFTGTINIWHTSNDGRYNADSASIEFRDGRVVRTNFSPD